VGALKSTSNNDKNNEKAYGREGVRGYNKKVQSKDFDPYAELVKERSPLLFCDVCMYYPIEPVHGHFFCPSCRNVTKCCEGMPLELEAGNA
jgi:hypothetical protein